MLHGVLSLTKKIRKALASFQENTEDEKACLEILVDGEEGSYNFFRSKKREAFLKRIRRKEKWKKGLLLLLLVKKCFS